MSAINTPIDTSNIQYMSHLIPTGLFLCLNHKNVCDHPLRSEEKKRTPSDAKRSQNQEMKYETFHTKLIWSTKHLPAGSA